MKRVSFLLAAITYISAAHAQHIKENEVPASVKQTFQKQFPDAKKITWEKEDGNYEAEFKLNTTAYSVLINPSGTITETEVAINTKELAPSIKSYLAKHYPNQKIKEAARITDAKGVVTYEAEINDKDLIFDHSGTFLKETKD